MGWIVGGEAARACRWFRAVHPRFSRGRIRRFLRCALLREDVSLATAVRRWGATTSR